jgi:CBS-domain-containing membrane protein
MVLAGIAVSAGPHPVRHLHRAGHGITGGGAGATASLGGHIVATLVGFAVLWLAGPQAWAAAAAVGLAVLAMYITGTFHPPAGINPLLVVAGGLPWSFLLAPVLVGTVSLTAFAYIWHRWLLRRPWPLRWL